MTADQLTVLTSVNKKHAGKQFRFNPKTGLITNSSFSAGKYFSVDVVEVEDILSLSRVLEAIADGKISFVIRGQPLPGIDHKKTRRAIYPDPKTGEAPGFTAAERRWLLVDGDGIPCPAVIDPRVDPEAGVEYMLGLLPPECWDATCWWQYSAQQSVKPGDNSLRLHLWFWLAQACDDAACKRWAIAGNVAANGIKVIDPALFNPVQIHYCAPPLFNGMQDPLVRRSGLRQSLDAAISLVIPAADPKHADQPSTEGFEPGIGIEAFLAEIGGPRGTREPIRSAIGSWVAINGIHTDPGPLKAAIRAAIRKNRPRVGLGHYEDDTHLDKLIEWTRNVHGDRPPKGFIPEPPTRVTEGIPVEELEDPNSADPSGDATEEGADDFVGILPAEFSHEQLALQFTAEHHADWRYVALWGKWQRWAATRWRNEDTLRAFELARRVCRAASARIFESASLARSVAGAQSVAAVEKLARADRRHAMCFDQYDAKDWDFNQPPRNE
jgi:hypothetical protein